MAQTVIGIFDNRSNAEQAVERLVAQGYDRERIDLSMRSSERTYGSTDGREDDSFGEKVSRFFNNLFDSEDESQRYTTIARSGTVVTVHSDSSDMATRASEIMDECGAVDVDERSSSMDRSFSSDGANASGSESVFGASVSPGTPVSSMDSLSDSSLTDSSESEVSWRNDSRDIDNRSIPVIEEGLRVGKREVERGGVRVRSRIIERPVEESLRLREEHVIVDRTPVNREATASDFDTFKEGEIEVRERAEVPVVNKEARVVEEVRVKKDVREREETVRDTVRSTDVEVDDLHGDADDGSIESKTTKRKF
ncbi:MAG TPA: YsnF/AvaK domain-containing protein [Chryseosolibacter sp.]